MTTTAGELVRGKVIVITGASRGIGAGLAEVYAAGGARLGLCARGEVSAGGPGAVRAALDVADEGALERFAGDVAARFGAIDLWVNNAGVLEPMAPLADLDLAGFRRHLDVNVLGVFLGTRAYVRHRRRNAHGGGVLVNVSSGAGRRGYYGWSAYCAGKAAVDRLTECVALEEGSRGLRAHAVAPGIVDTHMQELIRATTPERFAEVERFRTIKADEAFSSPAWVAARLAELAFNPAHGTTDVLVSLPSQPR